MTADAFKKLVDDAMAAIDDDDLVRHGQVFRAMQDQLPCLDEAVPVDAWSTFLVGFAVVEYAMGREWEQALDAVLRVSPDVERSYGPVEVRNYASGVDFQPEGARALPADAHFVLDGVPISVEPALGKLHIVQRELDGVWSTFLLQGEDFPDQWKAPEEVIPDTMENPARLRASVFALGGLTAGGQSVTSGSPDTSIPDLSATWALVGLGSFGDYHPLGPVGAFWDIASPVELGFGVGVEGYIGPAIDLGPLVIDVGAGVTSVSLTDGQGFRTVMLPQPHLGARYVLAVSDGLDVDASAGGGWTLSGWHGKLHAGVRGGGNLGWNAGLDVSRNNGYFIESNNDRAASVSALRVGLRAGVSFGS
jgi:hypothetical protein